MRLFDQRTVFATFTLPIVLAAFATSGCQRPKPRKSSQTTHAVRQSSPKAQARKSPTKQGKSTSHAAANAPSVVPLAPGAKLQDEQNTISVFQAMAPATVYVTQNRIVRDYWRMKAFEVPAGTGSGFIWNDKGFIVTNYHVIDPGHGRSGPVSYTVTLYDQKSYQAKLVGGEPARDVAVLKIDAPSTELRPIKLLPKGEHLRVGQKALAIGNPFGLDHTLTTGVISAIGREVKGYGGVSIRGMVQTDASINPGNSGGPLLDSNGRLIGMNTMILSKSGSSAGIGFAVPVSIIQRIVPQIIEYGHAKRAGLGIRLLPDVYARRARVNGVIVAEVMDGSPAQKAGLQGLSRTAMGTVVIGDVIVGVNDTPVKNYDDLFNALDQFNAGQEVTVHVKRGDKLISLEVRLVDIN